jgi:hypothetical protein
MTQDRFCRTAMMALAGLCALLLLAGCEGPRRTASPAGEPPRDVQGETPPAPPVALAPATAPSAPPAIALKLEEPQPENPPPPAPAPEAVQPPQAPAAPAEQELPPYLQVVERIRPLEPAEVHVDASSPERLVIETRNVRRIRIDREHAPLALNRSVVLRLDGQGIEWTADSRAREFERSVNGEWGAARERRP